MARAQGPPGSEEAEPGSEPVVELRRWIPNPETFNAMGFRWNAIRRILWVELKAILGVPQPGLSRPEKCTAG